MLKTSHWSNKQEKSRKDNSHSYHAMFLIGMCANSYGKHYEYKTKPKITHAHL